MRVLIVLSVFLALPTIAVAQTSWYAPDDFTAGAQAALTPEFCSPPVAALSTDGPALGVDGMECKPGAMGIENVFIIIIDGLRASEGFDDPGHQYIPRIWNELRPYGTIYTNFFNQGYTLTTASHATITSGVSQFIPNTIRIPGEDTQRVQEEPSIFQYYRSQLNVPADKTWIVNGKGQLLNHIGICQNPWYRNSYAPRLAFRTQKRDELTWNEARRIIDVHRPSLMLINLRDVDQCGHTGIWNDYVDAIRKADEMVYDLCCRILLDPHYRDNTVVLVTSDHGRHLEGVSTGFQDHGCSCSGCRNVPLLAIGSNIKKNRVITRTARLADIAPTVAAMLGFEAKFHQGRVLADMFENPPVAQYPAFLRPAVESYGVGVHLAGCCLMNSRSQIIYARSSDGGQTWLQRMVLSSAPINMRVNLAVSGDKVAAVWNQYSDGANCSVALRESRNRGISWSPIIKLSGDAAVQPDYFPDVCYRQGLLNVVWQEKQLVRLAVLQNTTIIQEDTFFEITAGRPRCAPNQLGTHVVYQRYIPDSKNWDVAYSLHDGTGWRTPVQLCSTPGDSLRPDIAADANGIHVVWAERDNGSFKIVNKNSADGITWTSGVIIAAPPLGAWHPRIVSTANELLTVWEHYSDSTPALFAARSLDGGRTWTPPVRITPGARADTFPSFSVSPSNIMHLFWMRSPQPSSILGFRRQL